MSQSMALPSPQPLQAIAGFAAHLREAGLAVGIAEQQAMLRAALALGPGSMARLRHGWRALVCHRAADWRRFGPLFDDYWLPPQGRGQLRSQVSTRPRRDLRQLVQQMHQQMDQGAAPGPAPGDTALQDVAGDDAPAMAPRAQGGASRTEALVQRGLGEQWLPQDLARLQRLVEQLARRLRQRLLRRQQAQAGAQSQRRRLDLRRTLRASLASGGLPLHPAWRAPRRERPRLYLLVDVSRSMETHAQLFLRIARAFVAAMQARVFVFHTRLAEVTPLLRRDSGRVQEKINAVTAGFGGGTRIASSLADFQHTHAKGQLGRGARVWLLSDGFDADPPEQLAAQLAALRGQGARIAWLHPTVGVPASAAMGAARPLVHAFAPLHNLASLQRLEHLLD